MKVLVTGTRGVPNVMGGVETHCEELFPRLVDKGVDVTLIRRSRYVNDGLKEWNGINLLDIDCPKNKRCEAIIHTFKAIWKAKRFGVDIVHIHAIGPALLTPFAKMLGLRVVFTHHGPDYDRDKWGRSAKLMLKLGERFGCMFADDVIVISNVIKHLIDDKYNRVDNVHLIYNGVPKPHFCELPEYFKDLQIENGKYVLGMCRFVPEKNLHHLIEAFQLLKRKGSCPSDVKLVLAGDTDFEDDYSLGLKQQARDAGVVLTGFVKGEKLHSLLTNALCYCLPSSHEGLPISLLEAMSYRLPVVVSDIPANLEVGLDRTCYFPCGNVEMLASRLETLVSMEQQRVSYDMTKYNWDHISEQVFEVYNNCVKS
ncbi:MAG: glycosyltransferase family 4 protein [Bacteroidales bacterium]|jgi:glycosyltransferase involved in cell wall biosynthesis|nr:glycosyltransferase family 4 protein [Bacteroidales bacterium]